MASLRKPNRNIISRSHCHRICCIYRSLVQLIKFLVLNLAVIMWKYSTFIPRFDCKWSSGLLNKMTVGAGVSKHGGKSRTGGNRVHFIACEWDFAGSNKSRLKVPCFDVWIQTWIVSRSESGCGSGNVMNGSVTWRTLRSESWSETKTSLGCESDSWSGCLHDH